MTANLWTLIEFTSKLVPPVNSHGGRPAILHIFVLCSAEGGNNGTTSVSCRFIERVREKCLPICWILGGCRQHNSSAQQMRLSHLKIARQMYSKATSNRMKNSNIIIMATSGGEERKIEFCIWIHNSGNFDYTALSNVNCEPNPQPHQVEHSN